MFKPVEYFAGTDIVVIGRNPENADFDNPHGNIHGFRAYVRAADVEGNTKMLWGRTTSLCEADVLEPAMKYAERLTAALKVGWTPNWNRNWLRGNAIYGSEAYQLYGRDEEREWEREIDEWDNWN